VSEVRDCNLTLKMKEQTMEFLRGPGTIIPSPIYMSSMLLLGFLLPGVKRHKVIPYSTHAWKSSRRTESHITPPRHLPSVDKPRS
jgi:hypothetical protein